MFILIRVDRFDFDSGRLLLDRSLVDCDNGIAIKQTKTDRAYRLSLDAAALTELVVHRRSFEHITDETGVSLKLESFVFSYEANGSFATTWPRPCSPLASLSQCWPAAWAMLDRRRRSTPTATPSRRAIRPPPI